MQKVRSGELPWLKIDALHRLILDDLLDEFGMRGSPKTTSIISTASGIG